MIDPITTEVDQERARLRGRRDGHRRAQRRLLAEHQRAARSFVRALRPLRTADRAGRAHSGTPRLAAVGTAANARRSSNASTAARAKARCGSPTIRTSPARTSTTSRSCVRSSHRGRLAGYAANKAHHADVGGAVPGSMPAEAADLFAEGFVAAAAAPRARRPRPRRDRRALPRELANAGRAQRRSARANRRQLYGRAPAARALRALRRRNVRGGDRATSTRASARCAPRCDRSATARSTPKIISKIATALRASRIALRLELRDGRALLRLHGDLARRSTSPLNAVFGVTLSGVHYALRAVTDPTIPMNEGCFRPVEVFAPGGIAAQPAPAGAGLGRKRRDEHAQRRRRTASARASRAASRTGLQRRHDEQRHARRNAWRRRDVGLLRDERLRDGRASDERRNRRDPLPHDQHAQHADRSHRTRVPAARRALRDRRGNRRRGTLPRRQRFDSLDRTRRRFGARRRCSPTATRAVRRGAHGGMPGSVRPPLVAARRHRDAAAGEDEFRFRTRRRADDSNARAAAATARSR